MTQRREVTVLPPLVAVAGPATETSGVVADVPGPADAATGPTDPAHPTAPADPAARPPFPAAARLAVLLVGLAAVGVHASLDGVASDVAYLGIGLACVVVAAAGIRRNAPARALPWWLLTGAQAVTVVADVIWSLYPVATGAEAPFPSVADVVYLCEYPLLAAGLALLARPRAFRSGIEGLLDAGVVTAGATVLAWVFVVQPYVGHPERGVPFALALVYALLDLGVLAVAARLVLTDGVRTRAQLLVLSSCAALLLADALFYAGLAQDDSSEGSSVSQVAWLLASVLLAVAALHPSTRHVPGPARPAAGIGVRRLVLLVAVAALAPTVAAVAALVGDRDRLGLVVVPGIASTVLSVLLVVRIGLLARVAGRRADVLARQTQVLEASLHEQQTLQDVLAHRTMHDPLTGLPNRWLLMERLDRALARRTGPGTHGLLLIDVDGFKDVNDAAGHALGDALLVDLAQRLLGEADEADTVARLGADEFGVLLEDTTPAAVERTAERLAAAVRGGHHVDGRTLHLTVSIGHASVRSPATPAQALRDAGLALHAAKDAGRDRSVAYHPGLREVHEEHVRIVAGLRRALDRDELVLHYQPIVDLVAERVTAVEALVRWRPPEGPLVAPEHFIPVAEQSGLILPIGTWVLGRACADARRWWDGHGVAVTVNVAARQLREPDFADLVLATLRRTGLPGEALILEITETTLIAETARETDVVAARLQRLRGHGVRVALDDFGTGYSSFAYLRHLPVDVLKIDRAFNSDAAGAGGAQGVALTRAILQVCHTLGLSTIAEGVETVERAQTLRDLHCGLAQGFLYSRPLPAADLDLLLAAPVRALRPPPPGGRGRSVASTPWPGSSR